MFRPLSITRIYLNPLTLIHGEETEADQCIRVRLGRLELPLFEKKKDRREKKNARRTRLSFPFPYPSLVEYVSSFFNYTHTSKPPHSRSQGRERKRVEVMLGVNRETQNTSLEKK